MSDISYYKRCPQCNGVCDVDEDLRSGNIHSVCMTCGRLYYVEEHGCPPEEEPGYGCMLIVNREGFFQLCPLSEPLTEKSKKEYLDILQKDEINQDLSYITMWNEETQEVVAVFGNMPHSFDELAADHMKQTGISELEHKDIII